MIKFTIFLFFVVAYCAPPLKPRIVNGTDAEEGEFPYVVSVRKNQYHICGGSILNENFILTAAHCVCDLILPIDPSDYSIQYGSITISEDNQNSIQVKNISCNYLTPTFFWDVAILELESSIPDDGTWTAVPLAKDYEDLYDKHGVILGWGSLSADGENSETLQKLTVEVYSEISCSIQHSPTAELCVGALNGGGGACNGDNGTALIIDGRQAGIFSTFTTECGYTGTYEPNVYARVSYHYDWIANISGLEN